VQATLIKARDRLVDLENGLEQATRALAANLVASYEQGRPDLVTVILEFRGFTDLLERVGFLHRIGIRDAQIVSTTRAARLAVVAPGVAAGDARAPRPYACRSGVDAAQ